MNEEATFLREFLIKAGEGERRLALDIGANIGEWTRWLSPRFEQVIAVEPDPACLLVFRNIGVPNNCYLLPVAAGKSSGQAATLYIRDEGAQSSLEREHPIGGGDQRATKVIFEYPAKLLTLEEIADFLPSIPVDFVKIDVEGTEADVLAGITRGRFRRTRFLIEVHDRCVQVGEQLTRLGYENFRWIKNPHPGAHPNHMWVFLEALE